MNVKNGVEWKNFETGEIIGRMEDTNRLGIKIIEIKYSVKPDAASIVAAIVAAIIAAIVTAIVMSQPSSQPSLHVQQP